jgi:hypothetical protein
VDSGDTGSALIPVRLLGLEQDGLEVGASEQPADAEDLVEIALKTGDRIRMTGRLAERVCRRVVRLLERDRC